MSISENTVEYAVRDMFKGKSLAAAAKRTAEHFSGSENMFLGKGVLDIDRKELEEALWERMIDFAIDFLSKIKPGSGKEHYALGGTVSHYNQNRFKKMRGELKSRVIERLGYDPFVNDDEG